MFGCRSPYFDKDCTRNPYTQALNAAGSIHQGGTLTIAPRAAPTISNSQSAPELAGCLLQPTVQSIVVSLAVKKKEITGHEIIHEDLRRLALTDSKQDVNTIRKSVSLFCSSLRALFKGKLLNPLKEPLIDPMNVFCQSRTIGPEQPEVGPSPDTVT